MAVDMIARMMAMGNGGGTSDAYTKAETDQLLDGKADLIDGKVPSSQLPSYVDDVLEYASTSAFPETGESGKIYISTDTNKTYRWGGSAYVEISESLALGETASTAYAGNKGKANADAIAAIKDGTNIDSFADVETVLAAKLNKSDVDVSLSDTSTNPVQNKAIQAPLAVLIDNGTKNLLEITATSQTINGVTFSVNDDETVTANGTATANATLFVNTDISASKLRSGKFTGCPAGGSSNTYRMILEQRSTPYSVIASDSGSGYDLSYTENINAQCYIQIRSGITVNNLVFKPMICTAEDWAVSHKFVPYAPTNRELYEVQADSIKLVYSGFPGENSRTVTYQMASTDFAHNGGASHYCGIYLIVVVNWSTSPSPSIYTACYSGGTVAYHTLTKIGGTDAQLTIDANGVITYTGKGKIQIYALQ